MTLDIFGFRALWSPYFFAAIVLVTVSYFLLTGKYRYLFNESNPLTKSQSILFIVAMILLYSIKGSPLDLMGHIMFYPHMIQMAFLYLIIPPILIVSIPEWIWRSILSISAVKKCITFFTRPLIALVLFNGIFSFYHVPIIFDVVKTNMWFHAVYTIILFVFAIFMWWPLLNKLEEYKVFLV